MQNGWMSAKDINSHEKMLLWTYYICNVLITYATNSCQIGTHRLIDYGNSVKYN